MSLQDDINEQDNSDRIVSQQLYALIGGVTSFTLPITAIEPTSDGPTSPGFKLVFGAHTNVPDVEYNDVFFDLDRTVTFAGSGSTITTQRGVRISAPTYSAGAAMTITDAYTMAISGQPIAAGGVTIDSAWSFGVLTGHSTFGSGRVYFNAEKALFLDDGFGTGTVLRGGFSPPGNGYHVYVLGGATGIAASQGGDAYVNGGTSVAADGIGGGVFIGGGAGGSEGGVIEIAGGVGNVGDADGGDVSIIGGQKHGSGEVGAVRICLVDGLISFFGASPVVKPTGVAVSAPGIHAALVALGLISS